MAFSIPFGSLFISDIILLCTTDNSEESSACNNCAKMSAILAVCSLLSLQRDGKSLIACFRICRKKNKYIMYIYVINYFG